MRLKLCSEISTSFVSVFFISSVFAITFFLFVLFQPSHYHDSISLSLSLTHVKSTADYPAMVKIMEAEPLLTKAAAGRIAWFKTKLPEIQILESTTRTRRFDDRVQEFFGGGHGSPEDNKTTTTCMARFFMTWISPTSLFGRRELLSLESVFASHPEGCVLILSTTMDSPEGQKVLEPLVAQGFRVLSVAPDLDLLFNNTPAQAWLEDLKAGKVDPGRIPIAQNLSNLMRLVVVYKYGGVYLDADIIILKDVTSLRNTIGAQSMDEQTKRWTRLNNAMLNFDKGHPLLLKFMEDFASNFNGNIWGYNGPYLVSRVVARFVDDSSFDFTVLPPVAFYPVDWIKISGYFLRPNSTIYIRWAESKLRQLNRETYGVHLWNKQSRSLRIEEGSIIGKLISNHCIICDDIYNS